jgi:ATP-dependent RNA helicase DeaD
LAHIDTSVSFGTIGLHPQLVRTLLTKGYEYPTPIQAAVIPALLEGRDVLGQAKTGTGKTAAFALPALQQIQSDQRYPQMLVVAPTRELALQVSKSCEEYSQDLGRIEVACIYGGASMSDQLRRLKRGAHVVVGTPGRLVDLIKRGSLDLSRIRTFVLDEADEMLRMGFLEEVEWLMQQLPEERQTALFSATMPPAIHKIACRYLNNHHEVRIKAEQQDKQTIAQYYWPVKGAHKIDALDRILEAQEVEAAIVFVRTKSSTVQVAESLNQRGYAAAALNGDMNQTSRERVVDSLRRGVVKVLIATDVAARGLDIEQITHVFNYDPPHDPESYVHRIGRTGRAGREGNAFLFIPPFKERAIRRLETQTKQKIVEFTLPTRKEINQLRLKKLQAKVKSVIEVGKGLEPCLETLEIFRQELGQPIESIAAALYMLLQKRSEQRTSSNDTASEERSASPQNSRREGRKDEGGSREPRSRERSERSPFSEIRDRRQDRKEGRRDERRPERNSGSGMETYRIGGGRDQDLEVSGVLASLLKSTGLPRSSVGSIELFANHTTVELPVGLSQLVGTEVKSLWINNRKVGIRAFKEEGQKENRRFPQSGSRKGGAGPRRGAPPRRMKGRR